MKKKRFRDMSPIEQIRHKEDLRVFRALDKAAGVGEPMEITIQPCIFGYVLIGSDSWRQSLMAVELGASPTDIMRTFIKRWNTTNMNRYLFIGEKEPEPKMVDQVLRAVNEGAVDPDLIKKISLTGTPFQDKVLKGLLDIPPGKVETYQQVGNRIGDPKAVRAIGNAVGSNPIGVIVPCHRVVRSDGTLGGFRWGENIKRKLLKREGLTNFS